MVETGFSQAPHPVSRQTDTGGDEVAVETQCTGFRDQNFQVLTHQRFTAREPQLGGAKTPGLTQDAQPVLGVELLPSRGHFHRVGAVRALQRAAVGEFGQQPERGGSFRDGRHAQLSVKL